MRSLAKALRCGLWLFAAALLAASARAQDEWTVMVYMDGDNNLEAAAITDFLEIAAVGSSATVNIIVLLDRTPGEDERYGDWTNTRRGRVVKADTPTATWGTSMGELNMGNPQTAVDFAEWCIDNYPANRYAFVFWDHGSGWRDTGGEIKEPYKSVCSDETDNDVLYMAEVTDALADIETAREEIDLVCFDACLMGMAEVAYAIREHASYMVGSSILVPNNGYPYDTLLADLVATPTMNAATLARTICDRYYDEYEGRTLASFSLADGYHTTLASRVNTFAQALRTQWNGRRGVCAAAAHGVIDIVDDIVLYERHGASWPDAKGLAVYFPEASANYNASYDLASIPFSNDTAWNEFLADFYSNMGGSWVATARDTTEEYDTSSAAGMQGHHVDFWDFCLKIIDGAAGSTKWVDFAYSGTESGTYAQPYNTIAEAVAAAGAGYTICIKGGTTGETLTIDKNVYLEAAGGTVTVGE